MRRNRENKPCKSFARVKLPDKETAQVMEATELKNYCARNGISPESLLITCSGRDLRGNRCNCKMILCAYHEHNVVSPYFAHRDRDKTTHITNCDAAKDYRTVRINRSINRTFPEIDVGNFLTVLTSSVLGKKNKTVGGDTENQDDYSEVEMLILEKEPVENMNIFVPITNIDDLYVSTVSALQHPGELKTKDGIKPEQLLINEDTLQKYKSGQLLLNGPKLIVADTQPICSCTANKVRKQIGDNDAWIMSELYPNERRDPILYYGLTFVGPKGVKERYLSKVLKLRNKGTNAILFGTIQKTIVTENEIICVLEIKDAKGRQLTECNY